MLDRIRQAVPDAELAVSDYGLSFSVFSNKSRQAVWLRLVDRPHRPEGPIQLTKKNLPGVVRILTAS